MALFPLGILSAAGAGGVQGDYELIETYVLGSAQASVTFSSLGTYSSTYKHLQIRTVARGARNDNGDILSLRLNGDSGSNYRWHKLFGNGSSVVSSTDTTTRLEMARIPSLTSTANAFGGSVIDLLDAYSSTKNTTARCLFASQMASAPEVGLQSGLWNNTASITSIEVRADNGNLVTGSRFSLYGIRG
jgi:hypothetical protein